MATLWRFGRDTDWFQARGGIIVKGHNGSMRTCTSFNAFGARMPHARVSRRGGGEPRLHVRMNESMRTVSSLACAGHECTSAFTVLLIVVVVCPAKSVLLPATTRHTPQGLHDPPPGAHLKARWQSAGADRGNCHNTNAARPAQVRRRRPASWHDSYRGALQHARPPGWPAALPPHAPGHTPRRQP